MSGYTEFAAYIAELNDLLCTLNLLTWDVRTQMPPAAAETRGQQMATLTRIVQERLASAQMGRLLDHAEAEIRADAPDSYRVRAVRSVRAAHAISQRVPPALSGELAVQRAVGQRVWEEAKPANNFARFAPHLKTLLRLNRELADAIGYTDHPYDALLLQYEPDMSAARLTALFETLKAGILPLLRRITAAPAVDASFLHRHYPAAQQRAFGLEIAGKFGYDFQRGRVDASAHPFEISMTRQDVRMTTRYQENYLPGAIFGLFHETGHALYEQGVAPELTRTALAADFVGLYAVGGATFGVHESQSRLWENQIGRSRTFWQLHFDRLRDYFPEQLADVTVEQFYRAVNRVQPSLIRVEADEVTYNLHIMLRVELEMELIEGRIDVDDLPTLWRRKMSDYLGVAPETDTEGVLQDIHWSAGQFGTFPAYTIGNVLSAQFMNAARRTVAGLDEMLAAGNYTPLHKWLAENIHRHGRAFGLDELLMSVTSEEFSAAPYLAYLHQKYSELYP